VPRSRLAERDQLAESQAGDLVIPTPQAQL
jgi:hypothetical protein